MSAQQFPVYPGWETVRILGRGNYGAVYEIERDLFGKKERAALKMISIPQSEGDIDELYSNGFDDASITAHFKDCLADIVREYTLMAEMKGHTNVVYCDDIRYVQKDDGFGWDIYIKMELLTPLMKALQGEVSEDQVIKIGRDLCSALVLCRSRNIIHRDIKPQNIFASRDGDYKLGDFGIAKTVEKTSGGTKIGTYNYMAPEVYNNQAYGHSADIYSLGLVLYWLLNDRRLPFYPMPPAVPKASDMEQARLRRFGGEVIPAPKHGSEELKQIVLKACAYDPKDRYRSADEMLRELNALRRDELPNNLQTAWPPVSETVKGVDDPNKTLELPAAERLHFRAERNELVTVYGPPPLPCRGPVQPQEEPYDEDATVSAFHPHKIDDPAFSEKETLRPAPAAGLEAEEEDKNVSAFHSRVQAQPEPGTDPEKEAAVCAERRQEGNGKNSSEPTAKPVPQWGLREIQPKAAAGVRGQTIWEFKDGVLTIRAEGKMENFLILSSWYFQNQWVREIVIEKGITTIGNRAFKDCAVEKCVVIPEGVTTIGKQAFSWCQNLRSICIPRSTVKIGREAFFHCTSLQDVYYAGGEAEWKKISIGENNLELRIAKIHFQA